MGGAEEKHLVWGKNKISTKLLLYINASWQDSSQEKPWSPGTLQTTHPMGKAVWGQHATPLLENPPVYFLVCSCAAAPGCGMGPCTAPSLPLIA